MAVEELNRDAPGLVKDIVGSFRRNDLPNLASAMSFQFLLALVPFLLFLTALLGFLHLDEVWQKDVAPTLKSHVSDVAFRLIDDTVDQVLGRKEVWWLTIGLGVTLWELSAATRVTMTALDRVYGCPRHRGLLELLPRSLALGAAMGACAVVAFAIVRFGPLLTGDLPGALSVLSFLIRWLLAAGALGFGVSLTLRFGTATHQPVPWVSFGAGLVLCSWVVASIGFGLYATYIASYGSVFGQLATFFVLLVYIWLLANAFLVGIQVDACIRERA